MKKIKTKPIFRTESRTSKGKSSTDLVSKVGIYEVADLKKETTNNTFEE